MVLCYELLNISYFTTIFILYEKRNKANSLFVLSLFRLHFHTPTIK